MIPAGSAELITTRTGWEVGDRLRRRYETAVPVSLSSSGAIVVLKQFRKYPQQGKYAGHSEGAGELLQRQAASPEVCEGEISQVLPAAVRLHTQHCSQ